MSTIKTTTISQKRSARRVKKEPGTKKKTKSSHKPEWVKKMSHRVEEFQYWRASKWWIMTFLDAGAMFMVLFQLVKTWKPSWLSRYFGYCGSNNEEIFQRACVSKCAAREIRDINTGVCLAHCQPGEVLYNGKCMLTCPSSLELDSSGLHCVPACPEGEIRDVKTNDCVLIDESTGTPEPIDSSIPATPVQEEDRKALSTWAWVGIIVAIVALIQQFLRSYQFNPILFKKEGPIGRVIYTVIEGIRSIFGNQRLQKFFARDDVRVITNIIEDLLPIALGVLFVFAMQSGSLIGMLVVGALIMGLVFLWARRYYLQAELFYKQRMMLVMGSVGSMVGFMIANATGQTSVANWMFVLVLVFLSLRYIVVPFALNVVDIALRDETFSAPKDLKKIPFVGKYFKDIQRDDILRAAGLNDEQIIRMREQLGAVDRQGIREHKTMSVRDRVTRYFTSFYTTPRAVRTATRIVRKEETFSIAELKALAKHPELKLSAESVREFEKYVEGTFKALGTKDSPTKALDTDTVKLVHEVIDTKRFDKLETILRNRYEQEAKVKQMYDKLQTIKLSEDETKSMEDLEKLTKKSKKQTKALKEFKQRQKEATSLRNKFLNLYPKLFKGADRTTNNEDALAKIKEEVQKVEITSTRKFLEVKANSAAINMKLRELLAREYEREWGGTYTTTEAQSAAIKETVAKIVPLVEK